MDDKTPVRVNNPRRLDSWELPAQRVTVIDHAAKPSMALLPDGELVLVGCFVRKGPAGQRDGWMGLWRSSDGGKTWTDRVEAEGLLGAEHFLTCASDGTLLSTSLLTADDCKNPDGYAHGYLHRSSDKGRSWQRMRIGPEGFAPATATVTSRNVLELPDGQLLLGVAEHAPGCDQAAHIWRSRDGGETWDRAGARVTVGDYRGRAFARHCFFGESFMYRTQSAELLNFIRVGPASPIYPMRDGRALPQPTASDRMLYCASADQGRTWGRLRDCGDYGMHYPSLTRLHDGRLLLTFTQRGVCYPLGLQAVLSYDDGETWDFQSDRIIIEGKGPWGRPSAGGFGGTVQLPDGTLVSCSTYWGWGDAAGNPLEVVRWRLPESARK